MASGPLILEPSTIKYASVNTPSTLNAQASTLFWGLVKRKERWGLSWRGRFLLLFLLMGLMVGVVKGVHPFLAITRPVDGEFLVVEGWIPGYMLKEVIKEFEAKHYQQFLVTGGP